MSRMAIDGSFRLQAELQRLTYRRARLACIPEFNYLLKKGDTVTEEEVVKLVGELVLHPHYTIPLLGCFRRISHQIIERTLTLLRLVPDLCCNSEDSMIEFDDDKYYTESEDFHNSELLHVVEVHVRSGKGLSLHELVCLAFCRAVDLIPFLLGHVLLYFKFAPPPFQRIKSRDVRFVRSDLKEASRLLNVVRASCRFLIAKPEVFTTLWDWSCFLDFVKHFEENDEDKTSQRIGYDIWWCRVQILAVILKSNSKASINYALDSSEAFSCLLRWHEFCQDVSLEKAGWYLESYVVNGCGANGDSSLLDLKKHSQLASFGPSTVCSQTDTLPPNWSSCQVTCSSRSPFFLTSILRKSFEMISLAVNQSWPVLLYGPASAGKTAIVKKLAQDHGSQVLSLQMDDQIDGKALLGSYVCTEIPGEFRWQPGFLVQAVSKGLWVVFEDFDKAPADVQSILGPLLEGGNTFLTSHGEVIKVHEGFRVFSTVNSSKLDASSFEEGKYILGGLWRRIMIRAPADEDLLNIVSTWYPELELLAENLIKTYKRMNELAGSIGSGAHGRFSLRNLLKWCKRIAGLGLNFEEACLPSLACKSIYREAVDVFAAFLSSADSRWAAMKEEIARLWAVSDMESYPVNKPVIQEMNFDLRIGRVILHRAQIAGGHEKKPFVEIRSSVHLLERVACSVKFNEPVLLVGETGTGKTTLVQSLAAKLGQKLTVLNLSQQSDIADLLGGFRPIDAQFVLIPLYKEFENLFSGTFPSKDNGEFLARLRKFVLDKNWKMLLSGFQKGVQKIIEIGRSGSGSKRKRPLGEEVLGAWKSFSLKLERAQGQISGSGGMIFSFAEGAFVTALKNGDWILLDEVNLAPPETLQRVSAVLEEEHGSLCLAERGDIDYISRHPNFRIFACMNPATDAGKRDLPSALRSRFTEYFVDDVMDDDDLVLFIRHCIEGPSKELVTKILRFYKAAKKESEEKLQDGACQKPQYSLRSLYRALEYYQKAKRKFDPEKALYDGFCMFFMTLLDEPSAKSMNQLISKELLGGKRPRHVPFDYYLMGIQDSRVDPLLERYVLTKSVRENLGSLGRAIFGGRYPVLLQGPTSSGKTSLVQYLAALTGHEFVRINNHEYTDLQEYLGTYITDSSGKLVFHEGALVTAVRKGSWIVLDELNLAPSDVLEALNRLLDDNREIFVPELHELIHAHPDFMLFATQNPPNQYGGRKMLSRAFRNRFVEIHVDEIPQDELSTILEKRCSIPESYAKKMIEVMTELQLQRQSSQVFAGKQGYITPRDLFRWADRFRKYGRTYEDLARDGYYLLAERLRDKDEKKVVQQVLEKHIRVKLIEDDMYNQEGKDGSSIIWTRSMRRLFFLVDRCFELREPVLLIGETGGGKTSVCQLLSAIRGSRLHILNCHQYTETSDFLGGFYPVRDRSKISLDYRSLCEKLLDCKAILNYPHDSGVLQGISPDITQAPLMLNKLSSVSNKYRQGVVSHPEVSIEELNFIDKVKSDMSELHQKWQSIFLWQDGPLVEAMRNGEFFLVDEISLADDSVLERLNSVLEPERKLALAEKGGSELEVITAHENFFLLATMNPGSDYGKKELSPALRNRFTEIWVPSVVDLDELKSIGLGRISNPKQSGMVQVMVKFWEWFNHLETGRVLTVRDLLSWVSFVNVTVESLQMEFAIIHGLFLVLLDGLTLGTHLSRTEAVQLSLKCLSFLVELLQELYPNLRNSNFSALSYYGWGDDSNSGGASFNHYDSVQRGNNFGIHPFYIKKGDDPCNETGFEFLAPTTRRNALRVLRAMQLSKPVLLEGSPGVGKTSLVAAIGKFSGHKVVRINLSEQTDIMDLLGSDLPVESDVGMQFAWSDGILLQALKKGSWVLLDELNLAPQSVLEGLNAILDHRAEVFIPELGCTYKCPASFRVFACQNPSSQGGGRKGLPKSFLNRFTKVYVDQLVEGDFITICNSLFPDINVSVLSKLVLFNKRLHEEIMLNHKFAQDGFPWEFNLRDVTRSCQLIQGAPEKDKDDCFLNTVYVQRMRTKADRLEVIKLYEEIFGRKPLIHAFPRVQVNSQYLTVGNVSIERKNYQACGFSDYELNVLPGMLNNLEAVTNCVKHQWLCILVGSPSSGKTSLIRLLSKLSGNKLNELNLSSATDISELLGCFEQHNAIRSYNHVIAQVDRYMNEYFSLQFESSTQDFIKRKDLFGKWLVFLSRIDRDAEMSGTSLEDWKARSFSSVHMIVEIIEDLRSVVKEDTVAFSWSCRDLDATISVIRKLEEDYSRRQYSAKFEWVAGVLVKAMENGEWIVLENANLCNPTVLDRINSLVEQSGSITVNECGTVDGEPMILHPHPQFRMFLTVNPIFGEVSRAMRNRGVEVFLMQSSWLLEGLAGDDCYGAELMDVKRFITFSGIPFGKLVDMMATAHMYAKLQGARLHVSITHRELARWIQLFNRLIMSANRPSWSLRTSWEHVYLSSLGEDEGKDIIAQAANLYLSVLDLERIEHFQGSLIYLPGGWPTPLTTKEFVLFPKESSVRQTCMYLEFLGAQSASFQKNQAFHAADAEKIYIMDAGRLSLIMFPGASTVKLPHSIVRNDSNFNVNEEMLQYAANWTIEQAMESDIELYFCWFRWFGSQVEPFCSFFNSFADVLEKVRKHPMWKEILHCRQSLLHKAAIKAYPLPILSMDLPDSSLTVNIQGSLAERLMYLIRSVYLLRLSYWQWRSEKPFLDGRTKYEGVLKALRVMEEKVLMLLVTSAHFHLLFHLYNDLLGDHKLFWESVLSSNHDAIKISSLFLLEDAKKIQDFCPKEIDFFLKEMKDVYPELSTLWIEESLLWVHGGHPYMPHSGDIYMKQCQLVNLCWLVWPRKTKKWEEAGSDIHVDSVLSFNPDLRFLAMQGVSMFSYMISKADEDDSYVVQQLEEMYQMLFQRFELERQKLEVNMRAPLQISLLQDSSICCTFSPDLLCSNSGAYCWIYQLPMLDDTSFFLDMVLLNKLSKVVLVDIKEKYHLLSDLTGLLEHALRFSVNFSSRPPTDLSPHQKILWTIDAWESVCDIDDKISAFVIEMWFRWHSFLWMQNSGSSDNTSSRSVRLPQKLFQPLKTEAVSKLLRGSSAIKEYFLHAMNIRIAAYNLWRGSSSAVTVEDFLKSAARSLFQQIINVHEKSFQGDKFTKIKSFFISSASEGISQNNIEEMISLLASSNHRIFKSLCKPLICPLLAELYRPFSSIDSLFSLGCLWLKIGALRYKLVMWPDDVDPTAKYSIKHSEVVKNLSSLELEIKVREECVRLAGSFHVGEGVGDRAKLLENLQAQRKRLGRQIVFRSDPGKFKKLKNLCLEFCELSDSWVKDVEGRDIAKIIDQVQNWQEIGSRFIEKFSTEYFEYIDLVEPLQVAIYEMKLGLSLILSSTSSKILDAVYSFMRFPRSVSSEAASVHVHCQQKKLTSLNIKLPSSVGTLDLKLLEKLCANHGHSTVDNSASVFHVKSAIYLNILFRVVHSIGQARLLDSASFLLLDNIFDEFAGFWMEMKLQTRIKEESDAKRFKFRSRVFRIENIMDVDISTLRSSIENSNFLEWQEMTAEEDYTDKENSNDVYGSLDEEWNKIEGSILNNAVDIHNRLFGSSDLFQTPGIFKVSDAEILGAFSDSYMLGVGIIRNLEGLICSFDAKLMPEHILCLSLEHEKLVSPHKSGKVYNFYKDPNAPVMAKMVEPLLDLKQRVLVLLKEWDDHPALQKILDVIEMVLDIPVCTPLAKALSGLQFLVNKFYALRETVAKFPLSDSLKPIYTLMCAWHKLEFESWPALLDEAQNQFELNARRLWFPLYSVLLRSHSEYDQEYSRNTIESLDEFIHMSSIGEFRRRLQLLLSFQRHICTGLCHMSDPHPWLVENVKILYNAFGFYVQFLPVILEHVATNRKKIEEELENHKKLSRWENNEYYHSMDNTRKTRQKLKKIIQKYTDVLNQPVSLIITQIIARRGMGHQSMQRLPLSTVDSVEKGANVLNILAKEAKLKEEDRLSSFEGQRKMEGVLLALHLVQTVDVDSSYFPFKDIGEIASSIKDFGPSQSSFLLRRGNQIWYTIIKICENIIGCDELWRDEKKHLQNRKMALTNLLNLLENCGLSKHRPMFMEDNLDATFSRYWLLQPSYDVKHLLSRGGGSSDLVDIASSCNSSSSSESFDQSWRIANEFYFKSIASMHVLQQVCLKFHRHFTLEQVKRSCSFLEHLISIQQEQRAAAYGFEGKIRSLRDCLWPLENLLSGAYMSAGTDDCRSSFTPNQCLILEYMWQQKHLLDDLCAMLQEVNLLLRAVERNHVDSCLSGKGGIEEIRVFVEKCVPQFKSSKDLLDTHLLGNNRDIAHAGAFLHPYGVTKEMENLIKANFQLISVFKDSVSIFSREDKYGVTVKTIILGHFNDLFVKADLLYAKFICELTARNQPENSAEKFGASAISLEGSFRESIKETYESVTSTLKHIFFKKNGPTYFEELRENIGEWRRFFELDVFGSNLDHIVNACLKTTTIAVELLLDSKLGSVVEVHLRHLCSLLNVILDSSESLLQNFLVIHGMVSMITHVLGDSFASLFARGFSVLEDEVNDPGNDTSQEASGTGMGEGSGTHDVSDQIENEDQLLGASERPDEKQDNDARDALSKNDKGVEMEHDFSADEVSLSEGSEDDEEDNDSDAHLESTMGNTGPNSEVVDEKFCDNSDENFSGRSEKYEPGPSTKDDNSDDNELRAREDPSGTVDETGELNSEEYDQQKEAGCEVTPDDMEDMQMDNEDMHSDPEGLKPNEPHQFTDEDVTMDEPRDSEGMDDEKEESEDPVDNEMAEEQTGPLGETLSEECIDQLAEDANACDLDKDLEKGKGEERRVESLQSGSSVPPDDPMEASQSAEIVKSSSGVVNAGNNAPEAKWSKCNSLQNDAAPMQGLPDSSSAKTAVANSLDGKELGHGAFEAARPAADSPVQKIESNPCRNVGDALEGWKERVNVSVDLEDKLMEDEDALIDENASEYGYAAQFEKGTAQALGHATADQIDKNISGEDLDRETGTARPEDHEVDMDIVQKPSEACPIQKCGSLKRDNDAENLSERLNFESQIDGSRELEYLDRESSLAQSLVSVNRSYSSEGINQLSTLSITDSELGPYELGEVSTKIRENAATMWRRYGLLTARLSHELAEQLRLVMEPTLASKLQGDYRTGKRINMKKVIPYIASHYRKDKIWLRRTRPNKRDYQVVLAIDDSRSMQENHCGNFAIEALVTVCSAMAQLEVGNLAVASFGKKGNVKLLHKFDEPFTGDVGVKIISNLTFEQENTILDEPMEDLLKYLNNLLDASVAHARLPSGHNPLQQLVLIIADGNIHEKNLRRRVRDILNTNRMVAFLILDSSKESITERKDATFQGGKAEFSKYMESFPFPYYVVLKNIEALPRTVADLLRQWFELMQHSRG